MDKFTDKEKGELRSAVMSEKLRDDFRRMSRNRFDFLTKDGRVDLDRIVRFVAEINTLFCHAPKPFKAITGNNFRI